MGSPESMGSPGRGYRLGFLGANSPTMVISRVSWFFEMRFFKALFGGIAAFFGILLGGLVDNITGAFSPEQADPAQVAVAADATSTSTQAVGSPQPPVAVSPVPEVAPVKVATATAPSNTTQLRSQPTVVVEITRPFVPNEIGSPRPRRRPGQMMGAYRAMAREIPSASPRP